MENAVFCNVTSYGSCKNRRFGGTYRLHHQGDKYIAHSTEYIVVLCSVRRLLVTANDVPNRRLLLP
jgi:hypothetical protein